MFKSPPPNPPASPPPPSGYSQIAVCTRGTVDFLYLPCLCLDLQGPWVLQSSEHVCAQMSKKHRAAKDEEEEGGMKAGRWGGGGGGILSGMKWTCRCWAGWGAQQGLQVCDLRADCVSVRSKCFEEQEKSLLPSQTLAAALFFFLHFYWQL